MRQNYREIAREHTDRVVETVLERFEEDLIGSIGLAALGTSVFLFPIATLLESWAVELLFTVCLFGGALLTGWTFQDMLPPYAWRLLYGAYVFCALGLISLPFAIVAQDVGGGIPLLISAFLLGTAMFLFMFSAITVPFEIMLRRLYHKRKAETGSGGEPQ